MRTSFLGKVHLMPSKYDPETRAKAVRLVLEHRDDYPSEWAAITAVSKRLGMNAETLRNWIRQRQVDDGQRDGVSSEAAAEIRALKRRNAELEQTIVIFSRCRGLQRDQGVCVVDGVFDVASRAVRS
jgi:transposase-like protein